MSAILRFVFYFVLFLILFRLLRSALNYLFGSKLNRGTKSNTVKKKSKFDDVEEAKYIEINPEDDNKN